MEWVLDWSIFFSSTPKLCMHSLSPPPHACYMPSPSHHPCCDYPNNIWWGVLTMKVLIMQSFPVSLLSSTLTQISSITPCSWTPTVYVLPLNWETKFHTYTKKIGVGGAHGGAVGWGTALQARRSRVWFLMVSLEFFIDIILPAALWPWGWLSL